MDYLLPLDSRVGQRGRPWVTLQPARLNDALRGKVSGERRRVDVYRRDSTRQTKPNDCPVVPWPAPPTRFPPVNDLTTRAVMSGLEAHRRRVQQVLFFSERFVAGRDDRPPQEPGGEVDRSIAGRSAVVH